jgi:AcrR family transcriptional regulator
MFDYFTLLMRTKDLHKEALLRDAVVELTVREGFDGLSMHKLAKAVGLSTSTIYVYFQNREDMLLQVYNWVAQHQAEALLKEFKLEKPFAEGLWTQWRNRYHYITQYPHYYQFMEQFRHSPLIEHSAIRKSSFIKAMTVFFTLAVERKEAPDCEPEVLWSLAFGPLYALMQMGISKTGMAQQSFSLSESLLKNTCTIVVNTLYHEAHSR